MPCMVLTSLTCDRLILSAGTLGTTNLLLRNRSAFPRISRKLGTRFCGNGDLLTLAINCAEQVDGRRVPRIVDPGYGPVITSTARMPDALDGHEGRGFYLQDAGYPQHLAWILHVLAAPKTLWDWRDHGWYLVKNWLKGSPDTDVTGGLAALPSAYLDASKLLERDCAARTERAGSFAVRTRGAPAPPPDALQAPQAPAPSSCEGDAP